MFALLQKFLCEDSGGSTIDAFEAETSSILREELAALAPAIVPNGALDSSRGKAPDT